MTLFMKLLDLYEAKFYQRRLHPGIVLPGKNGGYAVRLCVGSPMCALAVC